MQHPIQRLLYVPETGTLYTCTGPHIHAFNARTGELLAKWTAPAAVRQVKKKKGKGKSGNVVGKKRKSGDEGGREEEGEGEEEEIREAGEEEGEGEVEGEGRKVNNNSVSKIISAQAGKYILTVTNEDKTVRVLDGSGLWELSSRYVYHRLHHHPPTTIYILLSTSSIMTNSQNQTEQCPKDPAPLRSQTPTRQFLWPINSAMYTPSHSSPFQKLPPPPPPPPPCLPRPRPKIRNRNATARKSPTTYHLRTNFSWDTYLC